MRYSTQIKPISYVKANAAELLEQLAATREPIIITQNGEAKAVLVDVVTYEETERSLVLMERLLQAEVDIEAGRVHTVAEVFDPLLAKLKARIEARNAKRRDAAE